MIFIDTNYINRFLLQDIPEQCKVANELFQKALQQEVKLVSTDLVFFEVCWSLKQFYKLQEIDILTKMQEIISSGLITFQSNELLKQSILSAKNNSLGIEDNYNLLFASNMQIKNFATFDKKLANHWKKSN